MRRIRGDLRKFGDPVTANGKFLLRQIRTDGTAVAETAPRREICR